MARIGYLTGLLPASMKNGTEIATAMIADAISQSGHELRLMGFKRAGDHALRNEAVVLDEITIDQVSASTKENMRWTLDSLMRNEPISVSKFRSPKALPFASVIQDLDLILIDKPQMAMLYLKELEAVPFSIVWHAIEWKTYGGVAQSSSSLRKHIYRRESRLCRKMETVIAKRAGHVFALTESDQDDIRAFGFTGPIQRLPLPVGHNPKTDALVATDVEAYAGLLGNWNWSANFDGLEWFCNKVVPLISPHIDVRVGGRGPSDLRFDRVKFIGEVDSAQKFLGKAGAVAIPLITGTGVSMKVIEACSEGWPTVTTPKGVRGLMDVPPNIQVAETPADFAAKIEAMSAVDIATREAWRKAAQEWAARRDAQFSSAVLSGIEDALADGR